MKYKSIWILAGITFLGGLLRFMWLGDRPLWIDEVIFFNIAKDGLWNQEIIPAAIQWLFRPESEFWIRFQFALAGTLTIPAVYYVLREDKVTGLVAALFVATFPLFVFWSTLARPYAFAGLLAVLAWNIKIHWLFLALILTPFSIVAWRPRKNMVESACVIILVVLLLIYRKDVGKDFTNAQFWLNARCIYYIPALVIVLYFGKYVLMPLRHKALLQKPRKNR